MTSFDFSAYTESVIAATGSNASPRIKHVMPILIRKLHEFCIEADVTMEEWMATCNFLVGAGQVSSDARNEVVLVSDVLGVESLVDTLDQTRDQRTQKKKDENTHDPSFSAILGPFYRAGVPIDPNGTCIVREDEPGAPYSYLYGVVHGSDGKPLPNALVDIWHDAPDGLYDVQSPHKKENHCRGRFKTDENGRYELYCLKPTPYPIPFDHQAGELLTMLDRHPYRPAHIHFWIEADGHKTLVSQIFDSDSDYLSNDSVFAVKDELIVHFKPIRSGFTTPTGLADRVKFELEQDFYLAKSESKGDVDVKAPLISLQ